ncbi:MAG: hypothetical protein AB7T37_11115 [Dehalococcoidia bacterium]
MTTPTAKEELRSIVESLTDEEAERLLDVSGNLLDDGSVSDEEVAAVLEGTAQIERGESITLDELEREAGL